MINAELKISYDLQLEYEFVTNDVDIAAFYVISNCNVDDRIDKISWIIKL